jgi:uncharacterized damage-inducible protein DinB
MAKNYRSGAVGALLDEYERAIADLKKVIERITDDTLLMIINPQATDETFRSIRNILSHVVHSGYGYATSIHNLKKNDLTRPAKTFHVTGEDYLQDLDNLFSYTEAIFKDFTDEELEEPEESLKIKTNWGQSYDIEQLSEHAIVHILRHRRQIERLLAASGLSHQFI